MSSGEIYIKPINQTQGCPISPRLWEKWERGIRPADSPFAGEGARATPARATPVPRIHLHAVVVIPDHVHLLLKPLRDANGRPFALVDILQCTKSVTARRINRMLGKSGPVWEDESFDHVLRSDEILREKAGYIRQNPVEARLAHRPKEYRWLWVNWELEI